LDSAGILRVGEADGVVTFTLNQPDRMNALSSVLARELGARIEDASRRSEVSAIVITGTGTRAFCAGTDLKEREGFDVQAMDRQRQEAWRLNQALLDCPKPTIAAIRGFCLGGGLELALCCDLRYASGSAVFGFPEMDRKSFPGAGGPFVLARLVGYARAAELLLRPRRRNAEEMRTFGLVNVVSTDDDLMADVMADAKRFAQMNPHAIAAMKRLIWAGLEGSFDDAVALNDRLHPRAREAFLADTDATDGEGEA
jgi:enoyl-CoA hydratase